MAQAQHAGPFRRDKVDGTFVSAQTHPEVFAKNPGLKNLAARRGGAVLMDAETLAAFGGVPAVSAPAPRHASAPAAPPAPAPSPPPSAAVGPAPAIDPVDFAERHFAAKREAKDRLASNESGRRP